MADTTEDICPECKQRYGVHTPMCSKRVHPVTLSDPLTLMVPIGSPERSYAGGDFLNALNTLYNHFAETRNLCNGDAVALMRTFADGIAQNWEDE